MEEAWLNIYTEYIEKIDPTFATSMEDRLHIETLRTKVKIIGASVQHLNLAYIDDFVQALRTLGFNYKFDKDDKEAFNKDLQKVVSRTKGWVLQINIKDKENSESKTETTVTSEEMFARMIRELSKYMGFKVNPADYTTYEFAVNFADMQKALANGRPDK